MALGFTVFVVGTVAVNVVVGVHERRRAFGTMEPHRRRHRVARAVRVRARRGHDGRRRVAAAGRRCAWFGVACRRGRRLGVGLIFGGHC